MDAHSAHGVRNGVTRIIENILAVISIDRTKLEHLLAAYIAGGHILLADSHGVGKTSLARALAGSIGWASSSQPKEAEGVADVHAASAGPGETNAMNPSAAALEVPMDQFSRVQCTVDLLPQDILGYNRIVGSEHELVFNRGPIFAHFVLCDEINLLTPKTQGSFFQAMEEQQVTVEGATYYLTDPFFIIATMNLKGAHLFPLPAPQLDRFMIRLSMGYPPDDSEEQIVRQHGRNDAWDTFGSVVEAQDVLAWKNMVDDLFIHDEVVSYIVRCVRNTREHGDVLLGASPRTGVKVSRLARALALIRGETFVTLDHVKEIFTRAVSHRLQMKNSAQPPEEVVSEILATTPVERAAGITR